MLWPALVQPDVTTSTSTSGTSILPILNRYYHYHQFRQHLEIAEEYFRNKSIDCQDYCLEMKLGCQEIVHNNIAPPVGNMYHNHTALNLTMCP